MGIRIALAGNPNCGKTTMFNNLTGASQYVGNWPGVTVEKKEGKYTRDKSVTVTDLPGIYSLSPYSPEEIVARDYLLDGGPDVVVNLIDATNLERNLYLTSQILDLGLPVVVALNMMDLVEKNGDKIDPEGLSKQLGCPVVPISALRSRGMDDLMEAALAAGESGEAPKPEMKFDAAIEEALEKVEGALGSDVPEQAKRWYAIKLFEGEQKTIDDLKLPQGDIDKIDAVREAVEDKFDDDAESIVTSERYNAIAHVVDKTYKRGRTGMTTSQKIDRVVTNRWLGLPIFIAIMFFVYYLAVSVGGGVVTDWANDGISGEGWLYTGTEQFDEDTATYEDAQAQIEAYVTNIEGTDDRGLPSDESKEVLDAIATEEPEEPADDASDEDLAKYDEELQAYNDAQETIAAFDEKAQAEDAVATYEVENDDGTTSEEDIDFDAYQAALEVPEPDASDGSYGLWIPGLTPVVTDALESVDCADWLQSLIVDGIIAGVGAVIGFLPQMIILFLLLGILELCGYMARVAFIMDRIFRKFGLSGKSFIPMLIASGCGVPAVMSTKTIENEMDRRMTIMTTTMIPCGAKMPIIALVFGALASGDANATWYVAPMFYFMGVIAIIISGIMLKKTKLFAGDTTPFVMELPEYHVPSVKSVLLSMWERVRGYIIKAGTIIFLSTIVIWLLMNFGDSGSGFGLLDQDDPNYLDYSLMAGLGNILSWIFFPLGFDNWQSTVTSITGLVAKENVVATVGILTQLGSDVGETDPELWVGFLNMLGASTSAIVAFCAFNLLCAPCFAAMGAIRNQQRSAKWFWITIGYMCGFAWCVGCMLRQFVGLATGEVGFSVWTVVAVAILIAMLFQLFRPMPKYDKEGEASEKEASPKANA